MTSTRDQLNALLDYGKAVVRHADQGPLQGLRLGVKDIFDVAGYPTGGGNPQREIEYGMAEETAPPIQALLDAGARFVGKTQTDELTFSMTGTNAHFPSPVNVMARDRVTGGSSSGSAAAVAGGLCDIAIGSDTNGSIRAPASYCGLIGLRTTHGRISLELAMPLAPSFDTFGWFARDASIYVAVGDVLLGADQHKSRLTQPMRIAAFEHQLFGDVEAFAYSGMLGKVLKQFEKEADFLLMQQTLEELYNTFRIIQAYEAWQVHGAFLSAKDRNLGPGVKERFAFGKSISHDEVQMARLRRAAFLDDFDALIDPNMVIVMPTQPSAAPLKTATQSELDHYRNRALVLTSVAGLLGWPQITIPLGEVHGAPFGISLLGPKDSDAQLIRLAVSILAKQQK